MPISQSIKKTYGGHFFNHILCYNNSAVILAQYRKKKDRTLKSYLFYIQVILFSVPFLILAILER